MDRLMFASFLGRNNYRNDIVIPRHESNEPEKTAQEALEMQIKCWVNELSRIEYLLSA